jgi:hypothetical protein
MPNTNNQILKNTNSKLLDMFNASIMFDKKLYSQDIKGSIAHSKMLALQNIITNDEQKSIEKGLLQVLEEIKSGEFEFSLEYEDIHMAVENRLTQIIGEAGKKVHTARSRNDQVCTDFTLYVQEKTKSIQNQIKELISTFVEIASKHTTTIMPGMTHLQHAHPMYSIVDDLMLVPGDRLMRFDFTPIDHQAPCGAAVRVLSNNVQLMHVANGTAVVHDGVNFRDSVYNAVGVTVTNGGVMVLFRYSPEPPHAYYVAKTDKNCKSLMWVAEEDAFEYHNLTLSRIEERGLSAGFNVASIHAAFTPSYFWFDFSKEQAHAHH